jgi:hypothetical protein
VCGATVAEMWLRHESASRVSVQPSWPPNSIEMLIVNVRKEDRGVHKASSRAPTNAPRRMLELCAEPAAPNHRTEFDSDRRFIPYLLLGRPYPSSPRTPCVAWNIGTSHTSTAASPRGSSRGIRSCLATDIGRGSVLTQATACDSAAPLPSARSEAPAGVSSESRTGDWRRRQLLG